MNFSRVKQAWMIATINILELVMSKWGHPEWETNETIRIWNTPEGE